MTIVSTRRNLPMGSPPLSAESIGRFVGTGPGRGIGLLFVVMGAVKMAVVAAGYVNPRVRSIEDMLPDAI